MLEGLDVVPWSRLKHAYGPASDMPGLIRALHSADLKTRGATIDKLYGNIFHQGTRYQATPYAVPFLYELLSAAETVRKDDVVYLLVHLALGYDEAYLPGGIELDAFRNALESMDAALSESARTEIDRFGYGPRVDLDCYRAVEQGALLLIELLNNVDPLVRRSAAFSLAWFPKHAAVSLPLLRRLVETEQDDVDIANAVLALGLLARNVNDATELDCISPLLKHPELLIRVAAAIALAAKPLNEGVMAILIESLGGIESLTSRYEGIHFNAGDIAGYVSISLARYGANARADVVPALCELLKKVNPFQSLDVTRALLETIVASRATPLKGTPVGSLDSVELAALRSIATHGGWKFGTGVFANYSHLVESYGLPGSKEGLIAYLEMKALVERSRSRLRLPSWLSFKRE